MRKLKEWIETDDLSNFKLLRMILNGSGGSGKSVVVNTIVTAMRKMFNCNDVVKVAAPTGTSAYNVGGETFHHLLSMAVSSKEYNAETMSTYKRKALIKKFRCLLALIIDERSLVDSKELGTAEQMMLETIYEGGPMRDESWGGLPILILVGDDYQLPGVKEGALAALTSTNGGKMTHKGRVALLSCAEFVMELKTSKRLQKGRQRDASLMKRLRVGEDITDMDVEKLLSLHITRIQEKHGTEAVEKIKKDAVYLFYKNEKRIRHNFEMIASQTNPTNPAAVVRPHCTGQHFSKGIRRHFNSDVPLSSFLCIGAKVAIENRNFCPKWGLHNGACGIVKEIS